MINFNPLTAAFKIPIVLVVLLLSGFMATPIQAQTTAPWSGTCVSEESIKDENGNVKETVNVATIQGLQCLLGNLLSIAISVIGLIGFVMFIIASFSYLLSGGNSKGIENARNTMTYAVVGLVVALSSIIILNVIAAFTGVSIIKNFKIPGSECGLSDADC